tara:strand:- start:737 stop:1132 length:396 start_codon:yes stop_codon:yes gene_type:complete
MKIYLLFFTLLFSINLFSEDSTNIECLGWYKEDYCEAWNDYDISISPSANKNDSEKCSIKAEKYVCQRRAHQQATHEDIEAVRDNVSALVKNFISDLEDSKWIDEDMESFIREIIRVELLKLKKEIEENKI